MIADWICERCRIFDPPLFTWRDYRGTLNVCRRCYLELRAGEKEQQALNERPNIPEGCEMRFLFYWWLQLTGRLSDHPRTTP